MKLNLSVDEVLSTTRTVRRRLDLTRPVPRDVIEDCLQLALQAPNGSNRNEWRWIVVDDPALIEQLAALYRAGQQDFVKSQDYINNQSAPAVQDYPHYAEMIKSASAFGEVMGRAPAMLVPLMLGRVEGKSVVQQAGMWGSCLQAVWSFFLALRERGMGAAWTTVSTCREQEVAELLGIPYDRYTQVGLFPFGYTIGTDFKPAWRAPLDTVMGYNRFKP